MAKEPVSVSKLNEYIANLMDADDFLKSARVMGEVSNFKRHSSGHLYFSLKDQGAIIRCVMFRGYASKMEFDLENGESVIVRGSVSVYQRDGQYQLYAKRIEKQGRGQLYERFEQLKKKLSDQGLFDQDGKKEIPKFVKTVGVVTSETGAAVRDIINVISRRNDSVKIIIFPTAVQGVEAPLQIANGINMFNKHNNVDVIIVGRGGGSIEELWAFNEEVVANSIFESKIPVISAVGHETDFTISDFVADMRAPTPSAAAELAVFSKDTVIQYLDNAEIRMDTSVLRMMNSLMSDVEHFDQRLERAKSSEKLESLSTQVRDFERRLDGYVQSRLDKERITLKSNAMRLYALGPMQVLKRGYTITKDAQSNKIVKSAAEVSVGQKLNIMYHDGEREVMVNND